MAGKEDTNTNILEDNSKADKNLQNFLATEQYSLKSILRFERIFGHSWISAGGEKTTKQFVSELDLQPGQKLLDAGCGAGGSALFIARHFGVNVLGVDLMQSMIHLAMKRKMQEVDATSDRVHFEVADISVKQFEKASFDVIYSRNTILHIKDKEALYHKFYEWLKPCGKLFVTDFCQQNKQTSREFDEYVEKRAFFLTSFQEYEDTIKAAGFEDVQVVDASDMYISCLEDELNFLALTRNGFIKDFSEEEYEVVTSTWTNKISWTKEGYHAWGIFRASK